MKTTSLLIISSLLFLLFSTPSGHAAPGLKDTSGWQRQQVQAYKKWRHGKLVNFRSQAKDKAKISGRLYRPKGDGPFPAIIWAISGNYNVAWARRCFSISGKMGTPPQQAWLCHINGRWLLHPRSTLPEIRQDQENARLEKNAGDGIPDR